MKQKVAVMFGGRSTEHEISVITGLQVINNLDKDKYEVVPVYISKSGQWFALDEKLKKVETYKDIENLTATRAFISPDLSIKGLLDHPDSAKGLFKKIGVHHIDVAFLAFHGSYGEDGAIQGLLEMADIPYTFSGVSSTAVCMDKIMSKNILQCNGIPTVEGIWFLRDNWEQDKDQIIDNLETELEYPMFVKPANSGSSIGVKGVKNKKELTEAIEVAMFYDRRILVERGVKNPKEVNISVMGHKTIELSEIEMPIASSDLLSFDDKYKSGGKSSGMASLKRIIPAPIKDSTREKVKELARSAYLALDCSGLVRMDFIMTSDESELYLNEVNTIPGSISFYLWEPIGIKFKDLLTKLIEIAHEKYIDRAKTIRTFSTNVLEGFSGSKGIAGKN